MCTVLLPPGDNPIAVNKYISYFSVTHLTHSKARFLFFADGVIHYPIVCNDSIVTLAAPASSEPPIPGNREFLTLKMEALRSFETSGTTRPKPLCHTTRDLNIYCYIRFGCTLLVAQLVEALRYKPEGREFDSRWCHWNFSLT